METNKNKSQKRMAYVAPQIEVYACEPYSLLEQSFGGDHGEGSNDDGGGGAGTGSGENDDLNGGLVGAKAYFGADDWGDLWKE